MIANPILAIGVMVSAGLLGGSIAAKLRFPRITGYLIAGILLSPSVLPLVPKVTIDSLDLIPPLALGFIAYMIGGSLRCNQTVQSRQSHVDCATQANAACGNR